MKISKNIEIVNTLKQSKDSDDCIFYAYANLAQLIKNKKSLHDFGKVPDFTDKYVMTQVNLLKNLYDKNQTNNEEKHFILSKHKNKLNKELKQALRFTMQVEIHKNNMISKQEACLYGHVWNIFLMKDYDISHVYIILERNNYYFVIDSANTSHEIYKSTVSTLMTKKSTLMTKNKEI